MAGESVREQETEDFCKKIAKKIQNYPKASAVLKELGSEVLDEYRAIPGQMSDNPKHWPEWFKKHQELFNS
jgi:hypothetical protein